jgi:plastocyanin
VQRVFVLVLAFLGTVPVAGAHASPAFSAVVVDASGAPVADAVVSLHPLPGTPRPTPSARTAVMDQRNLRFAPHVLAVATGTPVEFPNNDRVRHHVYSFSPTKRFELRLYAGKPQAPVVFDAPGLVTLGCNIHDWMLGYIYVVDSAAFAVSDAEGKVRITTAAGGHEVRIWHPLLESIEPKSMERVVMDEAGFQRRYTVSLRPAERTFEPPTDLEDKFARFRK